jgi:hypothetical protein
VLALIKRCPTSLPLLRFPVQGRRGAGPERAPLSACPPQDNERTPLHVAAAAGKEAALAALLDAGADSAAEDEARPGPAAVPLRLARISNVAAALAILLTLPVSDTW